MKRSKEGNESGTRVSRKAASAGALLSVASLLGASLGVAAAGSASYPIEHGRQTVPKPGESGQAKASTGAWLSNQNKASSGASSKSHGATGLRSNQLKLQSNQYKVQSHQLKRSASQVNENQH